MASKKYEQFTDRQHILDKPSMYMGAISKIEYHDYIINKTENIEYIAEECIRYSKGWLKIFDEVLVNALDQYQYYPNEVNIYVTFSDEGEITITNTGPGFFISIQETTNKEKMFTPEFCITQARAGSNMHKNEKSGNTTTGGVNGYGVTLTNIYSKKFDIETTDCSNKNKIYYKQSIENNMEIIHIPTIICKYPDEWVNNKRKYNKGDYLWKQLDSKKRKPHTTISYIPDYQRFGYKSELTKEDKHNLTKLLLIRLYFAAVYMGDANFVYFNNKHIKCTNLLSLSKLMIINMNNVMGYDTMSKEIIHCNITGYKNCPWELIIGNTEHKQSMSLINGIVVKEGNHIEYIEKQICAYINPIIEKKIKGHAISSRIINNRIKEKLFIMIKGNAINIEWGGQKKEKLTLPATFIKNYIISIPILKKIWELINYSVMASLHGLIINKLHKRPKIKVKNYRPALKVNTHSSKCSCMVVEGNSAMTTAERGIDSPHTEFSCDFIGAFSLGGVPMNVRKEVNINENGKIYLFSPKLIDSERITAFLQITGLEYKKKYEHYSKAECKVNELKRKKTELGDIEFKFLKYGRIIGLVDQDEDGVGQIWGLFLNFIALFWPHLFKRNWIMRLATPIIRVYHGDTLIKSFYNTHKFDEWYDTLSEKDKNKYEKKYYKGLASNTPAETTEMMKNAPKHMIIYYFDKEAAITFEKYFGKMPDARKKELSITDDINIPHKKMVTIAKSKPNFICFPIDCSLYLKTDTKSFQLYNITRHIPHICDGMMPVRRKILYGSRKRFKTDNREIKVFQLCGFITEKMNYHHGDSSLNGAIAYMAQNFIGARLFPMLIAKGEFGTRKKGGADVGQPRYTKVKLNTILSNAIYPPMDDCILEYNFDEGERWEPLFFIPIIPMSILEDQQMMGTGWNSMIYARDVFKVIKMIKKEIQYIQNNNSNLERKKITTVKQDISASQQGYKFNSVEFKEYNGILIEYSYGHYTKIDEHNIIIDELPRKIWNKHYLNGEIIKCSLCIKLKTSDITKYCTACQKKLENKGISNKKYVNTVKDYSTTDDIQINIKLHVHIDNIVIQYFNKSNDMIAVYHRKLKKIIKQIKKDDKKQEEYKKLVIKKYNSMIKHKFISDDIDLDDSDDSEIYKENEKADEKEITPKDITDNMHNALMHYFNLNKSMKPNLNYVTLGLDLTNKYNNKSFIKSYERYTDIFYEWFEQRKKYYKIRINREIILCQSYIKMYKNIIKFINLRNKYKLNDISKKEQIKAINDSKDNTYIKINKNKLEIPGFTKNEDLVNQIFKVEASYDYLLKLNSLEINSEGLLIIQNKLKNRKEELIKLNKDNIGFIGSASWLNELNMLEKIIRYGFKNGWEKKIKIKL